LEYLRILLGGVNKILAMQSPFFFILFLAKATRLNVLKFYIDYIGDFPIFIYRNEHFYITFGESF